MTIRGIAVVLYVRRSANVHRKRSDGVILTILSIIMPSLSHNSLNDILLSKLLIFLLDLCTHFIIDLLFSSFLS